MSKPLPGLEVAACAAGVATWLLGGLVALVLYAGRDEQDLDALGVGLTALLFGIPAAGCALLTLVLLVVAAVRARGRLRARTWACALVPALAGGVVLASWSGGEERRPLPVQPAPSFAPPPSLPPIPSFPAPLPPPPPLPPPVEVPLPSFELEPIPSFELVPPPTSAP